MAIHWRWPNYGRLGENIAGYLLAPCLGRYKPEDNVGNFILLSTFVRKNSDGDFLSAL